MAESLDSVLIVALVLAPGYVMLWIVRQRIKQFTKWAEAEFIVATVAAGTLIQSLAYAWPGRAGSWRRISAKMALTMSGNC